MVTKLTLWREDTADEVGEATLIYSHQKDLFLEMINEGLIPKPSHIFLVNEKHKDYTFVFVKYLQYKYNFSPDSIIDSESFFLLWEQQVKLLPSLNFNQVKCPNILYKTEFLISLVSNLIKLREDIFIKSPFFAKTWAYFDHAWWHHDIMFFPILDEIKGKINKSAKKDLFFDVCNYLNKIDFSLKALKSQVLQERLVASSAYFFAASRKINRNSNLDLSLLLLHRSLDMAIQSIAAEERIIIDSNEGIFYRQNRRTEVSLNTTKSILVENGCIALNKDQIRVIENINFTRNRSMLTHSFFSITEEDLNEFHRKCQTMIKTMLGDSSKWSEFYKSFIEKPKINESIIFDIEDSFDVFIERIDA